MAHPQVRPRSRWHAALVAYALVAAAVVGLAYQQDWFQDDANSAAERREDTAATTTTLATEVPPITWLATPKAGAEIPKFDGPAGNQTGVVGKFFDYPMTMPILETRGDWLHIRTPERPNGSTAWVHASEVDMSTSAYRIVINVFETKVLVYKDGFLLHEMPAGMGKASTPTPRGNFFVIVREIPGPPGYGPVVIDTSGHSEAILDWQGMGDAIIALHGPVSASSAARIGDTGTYISNGCVRLHEEDQLKLADVPLGTPVDIVA